MAKQRQPGSARTKTAAPPPQRPQLAESGGRFLQLERETEQEFRPQLLQALQNKVDHFRDPALEVAPSCPGCGKAMGHHDSRRVWWLTRFGRIQASARRYRCRPCQQSRRPLLEVAPPTVVLSVDACMLGMQVRTHRRRTCGEPLPPLPAVEEGHFRDVKTGVLLLPSERVETSPGRRSVVRRFLVSCLGDADAIFQRVYGQLRELGWVDARTVVVIVGDGAEWIWNRTKMYVNRCEILDFWHALEHAWAFARVRYGEGSKQADRWVRQIGKDLRAGKVLEVIARLERLNPPTLQAQESLQTLIGYYREHAARMRYDEYLRLGYGIGSGAVESAHKQVIHARLRQAGMRWSEAGARRLLALRLLLLNDDWTTLDRLRMVSLAA